MELNLDSFNNDPGIQMILEAKRRNKEDANKAAQDRADAIEAFREQGYAEFDKQFANIPEANRKYPAVMHDADVFRKRIERDAELLSIDTRAKGADTERGIVNDRYGDLKDFINTDEYKQAEQYASNMKRTYDSAFRLGESITEMQRIFEVDGAEKAAAYGRTSLMKELNSLWGSDAVGLSEAVLRYGQLIPVQLQAQISGRPMLEARQIISKFLSDPRNREETAGSLISGLTNAFTSDPQGMMDVARSMQDVSAKGYNQDVKLLTDRTSPYHLKRLGVAALESLNERERMRANAQAMSQAGQTQFAPNQQPAAQQPSTQQISVGSSGRIVHPPKIEEILRRSRK